MKYDEAENMPKVEKIKDLKVSATTRIRIANSTICMSFIIIQD